MNRISKASVTRDKQPQGHLFNVLVLIRVYQRTWACMMELREWFDMNYVINFLQLHQAEPEISAVLFGLKQCLGYNY